MRCRRSHTSWLARRVQLLGLAAELFLALLPGAARGHHLDEGAVAGVLGQPLRVEARVEQLHAAGGAFLLGQRLELVQRERRAAGTARRGAAEHEPLDAVGRGDRELLRDHAAEADAEDAARVPSEMVEERESVGGVVGHRVRPGRDRRLPEPPLVVRRNIEALRERLDQQRTRRERRPRTVEEQQPRPVPRTLVIDVDAVRRDRGHGSRLRRFGSVSCRPSVRCRGLLAAKFDGSVVGDSSGSIG